MKRCAKCGVEHNRGNEKRMQPYCLACHSAYMRSTRPAYKELTEEQKRKSNCRSYANVYQRRKKLIPKPCAICGDVSQKHHDDYSQPLNVDWLCRKHHLEMHKQAA